MLLLVLVDADTCAGDLFGGPTDHYPPPFTPFKGVSSTSPGEIAEFEFAYGNIPGYSDGRRDFLSEIFYESAAELVRYI